VSSVVLQVIVLVEPCPVVSIVESGQLAVAPATPTIMLLLTIAADKICINLFTSLPLVLLVLLFLHHIHINDNR
jgi:hypothetical protein